MAFKYKMYMNKRWEDLNFVGRKVLSLWPGHAFESSAGADLRDTSYMPLLQTDGDGEKETDGENNPFQFAGMMPCKIYIVSEGGIVLCRQFVGWQNPEVLACVP